MSDRPRFAPRLTPFFIALVVGVILKMTDKLVPATIIALIVLLLIVVFAIHRYELWEWTRDEREKNPPTDPAIEAEHTERFHALIVSLTEQEQKFLESMVKYPDGVVHQEGMVSLFAKAGQILRVEHGHLAVIAQTFRPRARKWYSTNHPR